MASTSCPINIITVAVLANLECPVCFELMNDAMMTTCGHSFCSACAKTTCAKGKACPSCRTAVKGLLPNYFVRELISAVSDAVVDHTLIGMDPAPIGLEMLDKMGFPPDIGPQALRHANYDTDRAIEIAQRLASERHDDAQHSITGRTSPNTDPNLPSSSPPLRKAGLRAQFVTSPTSAGRTGFIDTGHHSPRPIHIPSPRPRRSPNCRSMKRQPPRLPSLIQPVNDLDTLPSPLTPSRSATTPRTPLDPATTMERACSVISRLRDHGRQRRQSEMYLEAPQPRTPMPTFGVYPSWNLSAKRGFGIPVVATENNSIAA